jgi:hypothetical protein
MHGSRVTKRISAEAYPKTPSLVVHITNTPAMRSAYTSSSCSVILRSVSRRSARRGLPAGAPAVAKAIPANGMRLSPRTLSRS